MSLPQTADRRPIQVVERASEALEAKPSFAHYCTEVVQRARGQSKSNGRRYSHMLRAFAQPHIVECTAKSTASTVIDAILTG